jgi:MoaA/NifB/PqqE/SkfB family radical SAM enzyme
MHSPFRNLANLRPLLKGRLPGQLIIQYSNHCNADCPQCGMRRSEQIHRSTLDQQRVKELIDTAAKNGIQSLSFTGGEPLIFSR